MAETIISGDSLIAIDIGSVHTRALLFDLVDGQYRFLAMGVSPTTANAPYRDIGEGIHLALEQLQEFTGRVLIGPDGRLITPSQVDGTGVDRCVATISAGDPLKVIAIGLLEDVSTRSAASLATTMYARVVDTFSLNDHRKSAARIDSILRYRPDMIVVAGGTDGGASQSVLSSLDDVNLAVHLLPERERAEILFAGNQDLAQTVDKSLNLPTLHISPNIRPTLDTEQLDAAQQILSQIYRQVRIKKIAGVQELDLWANGDLMPTAQAFGRMIRFISRMRYPRGVLGLDVGASATTVAAGYNGELSLRVDPQLGLGDNLASLLNQTDIAEIIKWVAARVSDDYVRDYIYNKSIYPNLVPATKDDLAIEQAIARQLIYLAMRRAVSSFPAAFERGAGLLSPRIGLLVANGSVLSNPATRSQSLLTLLDALQPTSMLSIALDQNQMLPALGAAAVANPILSVQVLDKGAITPLGTVFSASGNASRGTTILQVKITYANRQSAEYEVKYGSIETFPLPTNQKAKVQLRPQHRFDVGRGPGVAVSMDDVPGGYYGLVIDARGRPIKLSMEPGHRMEAYRRWCAMLDRTG